MRYVDTHCHLAARHFDADLKHVVRRAQDAGVGMLAVAADIASSRRSVEIAEKYEGVLASVGAHPCDASELDEENWQIIAKLANHPKVSAIGETGLDYYWKDTPHDVQKLWFDRHIELSLATGKPLSIHARDSVGDVHAMVEPHFARGLKAIWHCFAASRKDIGPALDFAIASGMFLAVGGLATFEDQKPLRRHIPLIPDHLLLLETDSPYLAPRPKTMDRNEPIGVVRVAEAVAELRGTRPEHIAGVTTENARRLLGF